MSIFLKSFGVYILSAGFCALWMSGADAASAGRVAYSGARANMYGAGAANTARMPSSPTLPINSVGNMGGSIYNNKNTSISNPVPDPTPDPDTDPECGTMTVEDCMISIASCINNGALPNGINDLFDEDVRNAILNGMGLCAAQVDVCIDQVEVKTENNPCKKIYNTAADVWIDFNSRRVQPEYYNFVLRKTGLTPNQAENTCWLLDRNVYGTSFTALNEQNHTDGNPQWQVTNEYGKSVASYNSQVDPRDNDFDYKTKPAGLDVNSNGFYDAQRGHYARWDAKTATCLVRVAAYNKDKHITNNWLFGAVGDERPAEVWRAAGDSFTCDKDLFGFSLMNDTKTVAVVGVGGGTVLGTGVGAAFIHGDRNFSCENKQHLAELNKVLTSEDLAKLNAFAKQNNGNYNFPVTGSELNPNQCKDFVGLYEKYIKYKTEYDLCDGNVSTDDIIVSIESKNCNDWSTCLETLMGLNSPYKNYFKYCKAAEEGYVDEDETLYQATESANDCAAHIARTVIPSLDKDGCWFKDMLGDNTDVRCRVEKRGCLTKDQIGKQLNILSGIFDDIEILKGEKNNVGKALGVGAAVGAGAGGLATAITALVEHSNISCRVGDGLAQVGLNKAHKIDTLKDFYVKWNLRLPDVIAPTKSVTNYKELEQVCKLYGQSECNDVQVSFKAGTTIETIHTICHFDTSRGQCLVNDAVAKSHGLVPPAAAQ